jgi:RimJ/RimL family protein N-acetyltransferase
MNAGVQLREVRESDLPILFEHQLDPAANQIAAFPPRNREAFAAHWAKIMADETVVIRVILLGDAVAGSIVSFEREDRRLIGYWIGRLYWGQGIATRALAAFLDQVAHRPLYAHVAKHNAASLRVLEKCGFTIRGDKLDTSANGEVEEQILILEASGCPAKSRTHDYSARH